MTDEKKLLTLGLRFASLTFAAVTIPLAIFSGLDLSMIALLFSLVLVLTEKWLRSRKVIAELKNDSLEAIHLTAELTYRVAEHENERASLRLHEREFRSAFEQAMIGMAIVSIAGEIVSVNAAFIKLLGLDDNELRSKAFETFLSEYDTAIYRREISKLFYGAADRVRSEFQIFGSSGEPVWVVWTASHVPNTDNEPTQYVFQLQDISAKKNAERRIAFDALHDSLTALPNRIFFIDRLQAAFRRAQRSSHPHFAVCYIDFDRFKLVNDTFGHETGDKLLVDIADRLRAITPADESLARLGGDEFAILLEDMADVEQAVSKCERIRTEMARPYKIGGQRIQSTVSIGIAIWSTHYDRAEQLLRDADTALFHAKSSGRDRCEVFSAAMRNAAVSFLENETDLRLAVERDEFRVFFQPVVDLFTGDLAGFESLIRWEHPERGLISPGEFISIAEETGLIFPIGEWMLLQACRQLVAWYRTFRAANGLWVAVNVSARQFMQADIEGIVTRVLCKTGLPPESLKLELTESAMLDNLGHVTEVMARLKRIGVKLCIDDFGTGYSSLSSLHILPLDCLKIDRSFVNHIDESGENREIVKTIISLANSLKLDVIAEGIESDDQLKHLRELNCTYGQGFYFAPPLDALSAEELIGVSLLEPFYEAGVLTSIGSLDQEIGTYN